MKPIITRFLAILSLWPFLCLSELNGRAAVVTLLGWNNLGMHCMDSDYSVFSILPPYNTIECQLVVNGKLITNSSLYSVTYQAVADPDGSFNSTAMGKGNYYEFAEALFVAKLGPEMGLAGWNMPGISNVPQTMLFEPTNRPAPGVATRVNWFRAEGIPISPYDDSHRKNPYPLMRLIARNNSNQSVATNDVVLPVSDEMDCRTCHASGTQAAAEPSSGWVWSAAPERDFRLNILRLHDERAFASSSNLYVAALSARGFNAQGLYFGVVGNSQPVLCAACHASEALGAPSYATIKPLTASMHAFHAHVLDPDLNLTLDNSSHRSACYRCHPGSATRCLRGAMGSAIASDGSMSMQCQSCHGSMSQVGSTNRVGWFMEPTCQSCHSGTATGNNGQIRYTSAFTDTNGTVRVPVNLTFATQSNSPAPGLSLYRFSAGHGGLQCEACHGSTHAEFPSSHGNDNLRNVALQGHAGVVAECVACHTNTPNSANGGPHGMHAIGQGWVSGSGGVTKHADMIGSLPGGVAACQPCHGTDYRGTVLSRVQGARVLRASFDSGTITNQLYRGAVIGCYTCHNGPANDSINNSAAPVVANIVTNTTNDRSVRMTLTGTGNGLAWHIISQPANGSVGVSNNIATFFPVSGFVGEDTFTFAAYDGAKNSDLATGTVFVTQAPAAAAVVGHAPPSMPADWRAPFSAMVSLTNTAGPAAIQWNFGDGTSSTNEVTAHTYAVPGIYVWTVMATASGAMSVDAGVIEVQPPTSLELSSSGGNNMVLRWPNASSGAVVEASGGVEPNAVWNPLFAIPASTAPFDQIMVLPTESKEFFRLRQVQ